MELNIKLAIISTLFIIAPLLLSLNAFKKAGNDLRLFSIFLLFGLIVDVSGMYNYFIQTGTLELPAHMPIIPLGIVAFIRKVYPMIEAFFFIWYLRHILKSIALILWSLSIFLVLWVTFYVYIEQNSGYYDALYQVTSAFMASWVLLKMIEKYPNSLQRPDFWITIGIFFYTFSTFFYFVMEESRLAVILYPIHFLVNISTYILFSVGFIFLIKGNVRGSSIVGQANF